MCVSINTILFFFIVYRLHQNASHRRKDSRSFQEESSAREAKAVISIFVLLGLSWLFGGLIDSGNSSTQSLVFQYLFSIFTTLQGFFIFILQCLFNERVWEASDSLRSSLGMRSKNTSKTGSSGFRQGKDDLSNESGRKFNRKLDRRSTTGSNALLLGLYPSRKGSVFLHGVKGELFESNRETPAPPFYAEEMHRPQTDSDIALMTLSAADKLSETTETNEYWV